MSTIVYGGLVVDHGLKELFVNVSARHRGAIRIARDYVIGATAAAIAGIIFIAPPAAAATDVTPNAGVTAGGERVSMNAPGMVAFTKVAAGASHTLALASDGKVYSWGANSFGELGNGTKVASSVPRPIDQNGALAGKTIIELAAGSSYSMALASDGTVYAWGHNHHGQLGIGNINDWTTPVAVNMTGALSGKTVTHIAVGNSHSLALTSEGKVYAWGYNIHGQLGNGTFSDVRLPIEVNSTGVLAGKTLTQISANSTRSFAVSSDGFGYAWGEGAAGTLGDGSALTMTRPVAVDMSSALAGKTLVKISSGINHTLGLASDGTVYSWGGGTRGQLGHGALTNSSTPVSISASGVLAGVNIVDISAAATDASFAVSNDGNVYTWGYNNFGQLGDGTTNTSAQPTLLERSGGVADAPVIAATGGISRSIVLLANGNIFGWGNGSSGALGNNTTASSLDLQAITPSDVAITFDGLPATNLKRIDFNRVSVLTPAHLGAVVDVNVGVGGNHYYPRTDTAYASAFSYGTAPGIATEPLPASALAGATATFSATPTGDEKPGAQWQVSTDNGTTWTDIAGATNDTLSVQAERTMGGYLYRVQFTNSLGQATSTAVALTITPDPVPTPTPSPSSPTGNVATPPTTGHGALPGTVGAVGIHGSKNPGALGVTGSEGAGVLALIAVALVGGGIALAIVKRRRGQQA